ncbi:hypothetical protein ANTPLA_LOCUS2599 [Anthophora plagiata]
MYILFYNNYIYKSVANYLQWSLLAGVALSRAAPRRAMNPVIKSESTRRGGKVRWKRIVNERSVSWRLRKVDGNSEIRTTTQLDTMPIGVACQASLKLPARDKLSSEDKLLLIVIEPQFL